MKQKHYTIPIFIPELACPFQCVYCNQKKISGKQKIPSEAEVIQSIEEHLKTLPNRNAHIELGFFGGNFTGIETKEQERYLQLVQPYLKNKQIHSIRCSTRPDYINQATLDRLKHFGMKTIELGAQSTHEEVLMLSTRGHSKKDIEDASLLIKENGFVLGLQMMTGLPGDTIERSLQTASDIIGFGANESRIYPCLVIRDTKLAEWYQQGKYQPQHIEEAVKRAKEIYLMFKKSGVKVLRMGLHPSEGLMNGKDLIAGPFHPSFSEMVYSSIWKDNFSLVTANDFARVIRIDVAPGKINHAAGYNAENKKFLLKSFKKISFHTDPELPGRSFRITDSEGKSICYDHS